MCFFNQCIIDFCVETSEITMKKPLLHRFIRHIQKRTSLTFLLSLAVVILNRKKKRKKQQQFLQDHRRQPRKKKAIFPKHNLSAIICVAYGPTNPKHSMNKTEIKNKEAKNPLTAASDHTMHWIFNDNFYRFNMMVQYIMRVECIRHGTICPYSTKVKFHLKNGIHKCII